MRRQFLFGRVIVAILFGGAVVAAFAAMQDADVAAAAQAAPVSPAAQAAPAVPAPGGRGLGGAQPGPCGPQAQLTENLSKNVDPKSRCFELRMYTVDRNRVGTGTFNGAINELHQRFREKEVEIFVKHGAQIVGVWQHVGNPDTLVWMLAYRDRAHRDEVWAKFAADPDWKALASKYSVPISANTFMMSATDYSPMK